MEQGFQNALALHEIGMVGSKTIYKVHEELSYLDKKNRLWIVPVGFETDLASIPRLPVVWLLWGDRVHREGVLHDFGYRKDCYYFIEKPGQGWVRVNEPISRSEDDDLLFEAIRSDNKCHKGQPFWVSYPVWTGVRAGGWTAYHKMSVGDHYELDCTYEENSADVNVCK